MFSGLKLNSTKVLIGIYAVAVVLIRFQSDKERIQEGNLLKFCLPPR